MQMVEEFLAQIGLLQNFVSIWKNLEHVAFAPIQDSHVCKFVIA
jgi:hypothetical protein